MSIVSPVGVLLAHIGNMNLTETSLYFIQGQKNGRPRRGRAQRCRDGPLLAVACALRHQHARSRTVHEYECEAVHLHAASFESQTRPFGKSCCAITDGESEPMQKICFPSGWQGESAARTGGGKPRKVRTKPQRGEY